MQTFDSVLEKGYTEDYIKNSIQSFKESIEGHFYSNNKELKHVVVATLIMQLKSDTSITYEEIASQFGLLSRETIKRVALRTVYLKESTLDELFHWLTEQIVLEVLAKQCKSLAKTWLRLYTQQQVDMDLTK